MIGLGAEPARIVARTGPAVCGRCYEVPEAMRAEVTDIEPAAARASGATHPAVASRGRGDSHPSFFVLMIIVYILISLVSRFAG
ncbi:hypothetical protein SNARM312S_08227 [Streptomyces narbonensis]